MQQHLSSKITLLAFASFFAISAILYPQSAFADPRPDSTAQAWYVSSSWGNTVTFNGKSVLYAYRVGYNAVTASPYTTPFIAFGRQQKSTTTGWGVNLVGPDGYKSNAWVKGVAEAFIKGFNDNGTHSRDKGTIDEVVIGTSNANYNWSCNNRSNSASSDWKNAGVAWGSLIKSLVEGSHTLKASGNDIESWRGTFTDGWTACGSGTIKWFEGYQSKTSVVNYNFGSNAYAEDSTQWTQPQQYAVSIGLQVALAYPQIYCSGQPAGWVETVRYSAFSFWGVVSEDAFSTVCGTASLTWQQSWDSLNDALANAGYPNKVNSAVASFYYP